MVLIFGKGKTGKTLASYMEKNRIEYIIRDEKDFDEGELEKVSQIVVSPGVPFYHRIYRLSRKKKVEIIGDVEFAYRLYRGKIIAITGTDGKSTTTYMLGEFLKEKEPFVGGNYGEPFITAVEQGKRLSVLELSSFQIYGTKTFKPDTALFLNFTTDHLDWHRRECHYYLSKQKLFKNMDGRGQAVLNVDSPAVRNVKTGARKYFFSLEKLPEGTEGAYWNGRQIVFKINGKEGKVEVDGFRLDGEHNIQNLTAAFIGAVLQGVEPEKIEEKIPYLEPLPYRIQPVREIGNVAFYNDSKSTTVQSVEKAVSSFRDRKVVLIAGGIYKGGDFSVLDRMPNLKKVILIGRDREKIKSMVKEKPVSVADSLEEAVKEAFSSAEKGSVVLFSPGCASFDMFKNYKDRGEQFNKVVESING
ncbi:MAG: UDP-N-acetylmuramoyl-L-alanine--D-glutamate ligase [Aquificae bacterium]|nr:UDP-N-acetylmuramoyl-L-alanine--D-glutamate ligase [Aquificota bacterium]